MADRYRLAEQFQEESIRRAISGADDLETLKQITMALFKSSLAQKQMIKQLLLPKQ